MKSAEATHTKGNEEQIGRTRKRNADDDLTPTSNEFVHGEKGGGNQGVSQSCFQSPGITKWDAPWGGMGEIRYAPGPTPLGIRRGCSEAVFRRPRWPRNPISAL